MVVAKNQVQGRRFGTPRLGLEPRTWRLIPMHIGTRSTQEKPANPDGRLARLDESFASHRIRTGKVTLGPGQDPRAVFGGVFFLGAIGVVMLGQAANKVVGGTDVEFPRGVLEHVYPKWPRSPGQPPLFGRFSNGGATVSDSLATPWE